MEVQYLIWFKARIKLKWNKFLNLRGNYHIIALIELRKKKKEKQTTQINKQICEMFEMYKTKTKDFKE